MSQLPIHFFLEDISFTLKQKGLIRSWVKNTIVEEGFKLKELNFIFCSDNYLLSMNQDYLKHDTLTDIITFDNSEQKRVIVGDIFISLERIRENAQSFKVTTESELHRVMIHGTLHLLGKEDLYLSKRTF